MNETYIDMKASPRNINWYVKRGFLATLRASDAAIVFFNVRNFVCEEFCLHVQL